MLNAKKSLGQHFLTSEKAAKRMVDSTNISPSTTVIEIGPGEGFLTRYILKSEAKRVICIEKDDRIPELLEQRFSDEINSQRLSIVAADFLEYELPKNEYVVIANIPYYITGLIIRKLLESQHLPKQITFLVQKEVAERIVSHEGKENLFSLSVKTTGVPRIVMNVGKRYFSPSPNVDSAIITISDISNDFFVKNNIERKKFFIMLHTAFNQKRKQLRNTLSLQPSSPLSSKRPEDLSLDDWAVVYKQFI